MKFKNRILSAILAFIICCVTLVTPTFATNEVPTDTNIVESIQPRDTVNLIYPNTTRFTCSGTLRTVTYTGNYVSLFGKEGVMIIRFINVNTGENLAFTFIIDNSTYTHSLGFVLPAGTYNIVQDVTTCTNFISLSMNLY